MPDTYFKLPRTHRWLADAGDHPESIGGRSTDMSEIGFSLEATIKNFYPINGVPEQVALRLEELKLSLEVSQKLIDQFIELVSREIWNTQLNGRGY